MKTWLPRRMPDRLRAARAAMEAAAAAQVQASNGPCIVKADPDKIVYQITAELPNAGLLPGVIPHALVGNVGIRFCRLHPSNN